VNASARAGDPVETSAVARAAAETIEGTFMILP
jgi:hypothetical protein